MSHHKDVSLISVGPMFKLDPHFAQGIFDEASSTCQPIFAKER